MLKEILAYLVITYLIYFVYYVSTMTTVFKRVIPLQMLIQNYAQLVEDYEETGGIIGLNVVIRDGKNNIIFQANSIDEYQERLESLILDDIVRVTRFPFLIKYNSIMSKTYENRLVALQQVRKLTEILKQKQSA